MFQRGVFGAFSGQTDHGELPRKRLLRMASAIWAVAAIGGGLISPTGAQPAPASATSCRQSWMPADAPVFCPWRAESSLPEARTYAAAVLADNDIFVLGGYRFDAASGQVIYYNSVLRSVIQSDGTLSSWSVEPSFRSARSGASAVRVGPCLFVNGGSSFSNGQPHYESDTQYARITSDGHLTTWSSSPNQLHTPRSNHSLVSVATSSGSFLYVVAGVTEVGQDTIHLDTVEYAKIGTDCQVGPWALANYHLRGGRSSPQAIVVGRDIVIVGGWGDLDLTDVFNDVQVLPVRTDGSVGPLRMSASALPTGIYGHATTVVDNVLPQTSLILSVAGQPGTGAYGNWISFAYVRPASMGANIPGPWRISPSGQLAGGRAGLAAVQTRNRLYVIGGSGPGGQYLRDVQSATFDSGTP